MLAAALRLAAMKAAAAGGSGGRTIIKRS